MVSLCLVLEIVLEKNNDRETEGRVTEGEGGRFWGKVFIRRE